MSFGRSIQAVALLSLLIVMSFSSLVTIPERASAYILRDPILIHGNGEFTPANGVTGGNGTSSDPYIIEGWQINADEPPYDAIRIDNTDAHFIIRDVILSAGGIPVNFFRNVTNGILENSVLSGHWNEIFVARCSNIIIRNNSLVGSNPRAISIYVAQSTDSIITGNTITTPGEVDIRLDMSSNITVADNDISRAEVGIKLFYSRDNFITGNIIDSEYEGIDVGEDSDNATIVDNTISVLSPYYVDIYIGLSKNITMINNTMSRGGILLRGDSLEHWNTHVITPSNTVAGKTVHYLKNSIGGVISSEAGQVILANCSHVNVNNLDVSGVHAALQIGFSMNSTITRNHVYDNVWGLTSYFSDGNTIVENTLRNNAVFAVFLENSTENEISDNTFFVNENSSINLWHSFGNRILNNTVSFTSREAISLWKSNNNTILGNVVLSNGYGVLLFTSEHNRIHHNSIMGNGVQAEDDMLNPTNNWDDGYPSGGNYWSDYGGVDTMRGPNQDLHGSDGIGDTPYPIELDNQDRYPLMFPPSMPPPRPPRVLEANLVGIDSKDVALTWSLSPDDGAGLDSVVGYEIHRNMTYNWGGWGYGLIASLPNGLTDFVDSSAGEGDSNNYFYQVCAVDVNGKTSCDWNQAGKFTRPVNKGPNLLSIPLIQSDESIEKVLQTLEFDGAWTYDPVSSDWKSYLVSKPYKGDLWRISHKVGFWVNITGGSSLTVAGIVPLSTMLQLRAGWNLVPFPSFRSTYTVSDLKAGTGALRVEGLNSFSPPYFLRVLAEMEVLRAGCGYWVRVENDRIWTVDSS